MASAALNGTKIRTKEPAVKPAQSPAAKPAIVRPAVPPIHVRPTIAPVAKPAIVLPASRPAIVIPSIRFDEGGAEAGKRAARKPPPDDTEIDLADLINGPVPRSRMILCPFHGETTPSMRIYRDHYYCFGCGAYGDHVDWLVQVEGLEYDQALHIVDNWEGPVVPRSRARRRGAERTARALRWWNGAQPIAGTLAARYLAEVRGIDLDVLPDDIGERAFASTRIACSAPAPGTPA